MRLLILAVLLGMSSALQPGFEYTYRYRGHVALGIPSISSQMAASAFYCDAKIQVLETFEYNVQFSNIFIGDMNSRVTCEDKRSQSDGYTQVDFQPIEQYKEQLEKPFGLRFAGLYFPDSDEVWMRNLRRGFVHMLHIPRAKKPYVGPTLMANFPSFTKFEVHPLGECPSLYTVTPLKEHLHKYYLPAPLENDAQGDLQNDYWRVSKSVDFDNCTDTVSSHTFGSMLPGKSDNDNCGEDYVSKSTTGFYIMKGGLDAVRLEKAVQEGTYIVDYDNVHTYINQTLDLRSVDPIVSLFDVSGSFYGFRQETDEFSWKSDDSSGSNIDKETSIQEIKSYAIQRFKEAAETVNTGKPFNFAEDMEALSSSANLLSKEDLQEIYDALSGDARSLFMKSLTASGLEIPYLFLMEKLSEKTDEVSLANKIDFILNAAQNTKTTKIIEPMMHRVIDGEGLNYLRSFAVINFATLATRMCTKPCGREYLGETGCQIDNCKMLVEDTYLPWLEQGLNDETNKLWERMVYMMAIYNFNSEKILPIVRPYVTGAKKVDVRLRVSAIYALRKDDMPSSTKNEILQLLMAVFDNYQELYRVREAAFTVMLSWEPEPSWWQYMALNTWRDPSSYVVNLVSNTIYTFKEFRPAARRVAALTKPVKPKAMSSSFLAYSKDGTNADMMRYWYEFIFSGNDEGIFPRMISAYLRLGLAKTNFDALKIIGHFDGSDILQELFGPKPRESDHVTVNTDTRSINDKVLDILSKLEMETKTPAKNFESFLHMTFFNNLQAFIPLLSETDDCYTTNVKFCILGFIIKLLAPFNNFNVNRQFFVNSGRISHAYATEVGLPYMTTYTQPIFFSFVGKSSVAITQSGPTTKKTSIDIEMTIRADRFTQSSTRVLVPWMGKAMVSGINKQQLLVLPFKFQIAYDEDINEFTFKVDPTDQSTKEHFGIYSTPFTLRAPIVTPKRLSALEDFKIIRKGPETFKDDLIFPGTGFNLGAVFLGDVQPLFTRGSSNNFYASFFKNTDFQPFPPTNKYYLYKIGADYTKSKANGITISAQHVNNNILVDLLDSFIFKTIFRKDSGPEIRTFGANVTWNNNKLGMRVDLKRSEYEDEPASNMCFTGFLWFPMVMSMMNTQDFQLVSKQREGISRTLGQISSIIFPPLLHDFMDLITMRRGPDEDLPDHISKFVFTIDQGDSCTSWEPAPHYLTLEGSMIFTEEKRERLTSETCKEPQNFVIPIYDKISGSIYWREGYEISSPLLSYIFTYFLPGVMFPKVHYKYEVNESPATYETAATFEAYRKDDRWMFTFKKPNMTAVAEGIEVPQFIEELLFSPRPSEDTIYDKLFLGSGRPFCYATTSQIQTFDGLTFDHALGKCWTLAVGDCKPYTPTQGLVLVRYNDGFEASILWIEFGVELHITKDGVRNNKNIDEPFTDLWEIKSLRQPKGFVVQLNWVTVSVSSTGIKIEVHPVYKGNLCGACSNYDGDASTVTGPKGCSYDDYDLFMTAWTIPPSVEDDCYDNVDLASKRDQVKAYQASCAKQFIYPTGQVLTSMEESCFEYEYDVKTEGDYICTSTEPISACKPGCTTAIPYRSTMMYNCVVSDDPANKKQKVSGLATYPRPGCSYFKKWWTTQSTGCED